MKLQFKIQQYQTDAVDAVVDCFAGQPFSDGIRYLIDPGDRAGTSQPQLEGYEEAGLRNADIALTGEQLLDNLNQAQRASNLPPSKTLSTSKAAARRGTPNLDVEMETGTGKTYVYTKTILELHKRYGWSKFIIVVPTVAIREGVKKSFDITADHFQQQYGTRPRTFVYDSSQLHEVESFSSDAGVQVMIINIQAFRQSVQARDSFERGKRASSDHLRMFTELDDFQSRRPIDVIRANQPIVIIDEPQKMSASASLKAIAELNPLMILRYSATHKIDHDKVHRLDALDAFNQKLVKRIAVRGITVKGLAGTAAYLYLEGIEVSRKAPRARLELEVQTKSGVRRQVRKVDKGTNLHALSNGLEAYRGLTIVDIDANRDIIELSNGDVIESGRVTSDVTDEAKRRIQIREVIRAHLDTERDLHRRGIKVLSLFFIDEVAKYRDYDREDTLGDYARVFEEEYGRLVRETLDELPIDAEYREHLTSISVRDTHEGYFSIDKSNPSRFVESEVYSRGDEEGNAKDADDVYELILKDKERLLSFDEPVRFIFSHSALREGWDNPNVFVMGMLKKSDNTVSRRQEIGRGLRLCVDQDGNRVDDPNIAHEVNELTVVTDESYTDFVAGLQREISESLSDRPRQASTEYFTDKVIVIDGDKHVITEALARAAYNYLVRNDYVDDEGHITDTYVQARDEDELAIPTSEALAEEIDAIQPLIDALYLDVDFVQDGRKEKRLPLNEENFRRAEFQALWHQINHKVIYQVEFDSEELVSKCVDAVDRHLRVAQMQYVIESGSQLHRLSAETIGKGQGFDVGRTETRKEQGSATSQVSYDLIGEVADKTTLTRRTVAEILQTIHPGKFGMFRTNPEHFITEVSRLVNEQKATVIVEHLSYDTTTREHDSAIFTENQTKQDLSRAGGKLDKHIYDYVVTDSNVERAFVNDLETSSEVVVYAKLPRGFFIPTPVGNYNPDWAIAFQKGSVRHVYFVAETKGSMSSLQLKGVENAKIDCARKFFATLSEKADSEVEYDVVTDYGQLMTLVQ